MLETRLAEVYFGALPLRYSPLDKDRNDFETILRGLEHIASEQGLQRPEVALLNPRDRLMIESLSARILTERVGQLQVDYGSVASGVGEVQSVLYGVLERHGILDKENRTPRWQWPQSNHTLSMLVLDTGHNHSQDPNGSQTGHNHSQDP